jgi:hypothetical protein
VCEDNTMISDSSSDSQPGASASGSVSLVTQSHFSGPIFVRLTHFREICGLLWTHFREIDPFS